MDESFATQVSWIGVTEKEVDSPDVAIEVFASVAAAVKVPVAGAVVARPSALSFC